MKKVLGIFVVLAAIGSVNIFAADAAATAEPAAATPAPAPAAAPIGLSVGSELALEGNFSAIGVGHWVDYYKSTGLIDFEGYVQLNPYFYSSLGAGGLYVEGDVYMNLSLAKDLTLIPEISSQSSYGLSASPVSYSYVLEPSLKLDTGSFYVKAGVPLAFMSPLGVGTFLQPGVVLGDLKFYLRADITYNPALFAKLKWYVEKGVGPFVVYAYGTMTGFSSTFTYNQYLGVYFAF